MYSVLRDRMNKQYWKFFDARRIQEAQTLERAFNAWWVKKCKTPNTRLGIK